MTTKSGSAGFVLNLALAIASFVGILVALWVVFGGYVPTTKRQAQRVEIGSTVRLKDLDSEEVLRLTILPAGETPAESTQILADSPLGRALLGKERTTYDPASDRAIPTVIEVPHEGRWRRLRFDPDAPQFPYDQKIETLDLPQRIFYFHVPFAILTFLAVFLVGGASLGYLLTRRRTWDRLARSGAEVGVVFCTVVLVTGPIWAKPEWGHYWTWEWRLNFTAILWLIYVAYNLVRSYATSVEEASLVSSVLGIISVPLVPLVYFAAELWEGSHPKPTIGRGGPSHDPLVSQGFLICFLALALVFTTLIVLRTRLLGLEEQVERLKQRHLAGTAEPAAPGAPQ